MLKYGSNCFLLLVPVFIWNIAFVGSLPQAYSPEIFSRGIPPLLIFAEHSLRVAVFSLPVFMPLSLAGTRQRIGFGLYSVGLALYFSSWLLQIFQPSSFWSSSGLGFLAPAYTPMIWLTGIALIGDRFYGKIPYHPAVFAVVSALFVIVHTSHAYLVYARF